MTRKVVGSQDDCNSHSVVPDSCTVLISFLDTSKSCRQTVADNSFLISGQFHPSSETRCRQCEYCMFDNMQAGSGPCAGSSDTFPPFMCGNVAWEAGKLSNKGHKSQELSKLVESVLRTCQ